MNLYVIDTHALFWYLTASPKLGKKAKQAFREGADGDALLYDQLLFWPNCSS